MEAESIKIYSLCRISQILPVKAQWSRKPSAFNVSAYKLIRVEVGLENDSQRQIGQLEKNIEALIAGVDLTALNKTQLKQLLKQIELAIDDFYSSCEEQIQQTINDIGDNEASYLPRLFVSVTDDNSGIKHLSDAQITSLTAGILLGGLTLKETFAAQKAQLISNAFEAGFNILITSGRPIN